MKIGIVTPFDSRNFGNRLQNYALQQVLLRYADQVVTIKNKPALGLLDRIRRSSPLAESVTVNRLLGDRRKAKILEFNRKRLRVTRKGYWYNRPRGDLRKEDRCDWYCAGSDQIWNPNLDREGGFNFLSFAPGDRTFSFAASFGVAELPREKREKMKMGLAHIRFLSLREEAGREIVRTLTGRTDARVLPDPTLLLTREEWEEVMEAPRQPLPESYLLKYFLGPVSEERQRAMEAPGMESIDIQDPDSPFHAIGPGEFLYLIQNAGLVCTDSFHGSVFAFLFGRPLRVFPREGEGSNMGSRLDTLLKTYHLESCRAGERLPVKPLTADYRAGYEALKRERSRAMTFLDNILGGEAKE